MRMPHAHAQVRFAFRDSIEAATCALHEKIKSGEVVISDGRFPPLAHELFRQFGPAGKLFQRIEGESKTSAGTGLVDWQGQTHAPRRKPGTKPKLSAWQRVCEEEECVLCGVRRLAPGTSTWAGTGVYSYLNEEPYTHADPPVAGTGVGVFAPVPRPPNRWMPERFGADGGPKAFLGLVNTRAERQAALDKIEEAEREGGGTPGRDVDSAIALNDESHEGGGEEADASGSGGVGGSGGAGSGSVMLSDDGEDYVCSHAEDVSEGETDELASDVDAEELLKFQRVGGDGVYRPMPGTADWRFHGRPVPDTKALALYGKTRKEAAKALLATPFSYGTASTSTRLPRGSACPPPPPAVDEPEADDEADEGSDDGAESEGDEGEQLYDDFFNEALRGEEELDDVDALHGGGADESAKEFYGGHRAKTGVALRPWHATPWDALSEDDSDGDGYGDSYDEDDEDDDRQFFF